MGDGFYKSKDLTDSIKVLKEKPRDKSGCLMSYGIIRQTVLEPRCWCSIAKRTLCATDDQCL